eukprot:10451131-Karenia_brevis.AAC.1
MEAFHFKLSDLNKVRLSNDTNMWETFDAEMAASTPFAELEARLHEALHDRWIPRESAQALVEDAA